MFKKSLIAALLAIGSLHGIPATAAPVIGTAAAALTASAPDSPLTVVLSVKKIIVKDKKEVRIDADNAAPGDVLEYRADYKNVGTVALSKAVVTLPMPMHTTLVEGSSQPAGATASNRNAITMFTSPLLLPQAPGDAIGALRWTVAKLAPGQTATVSARVRVDALQAAEAPATPVSPGNSAGGKK
ncbi:MAG TPA: hypothetical protein VGM52_04545 [Herbaspirillum sp.]|jgi:uncharacterized repeat protein (TIGR01451 family)